jgi:hypothetical protein
MDWQQLITIGLVALAAVYVLRRAWWRCADRKVGACSGCHACPAAAPDRPAIRPFIDVKALGVPADSDRAES